MKLQFVLVNLSLLAFGVASSGLRGALENEEQGGVLRGLHGKKTKHDGKKKKPAVKKLVKKPDKKNRQNRQEPRQKTHQQVKDKGSGGKGSGGSGSNNSNNR